MAQQVEYCVPLGQVAENKDLIGKMFIFRKDGNEYDNDQNDELGVYERPQEYTHKILRYVDINNGIYEVGYKYQIRKNGSYGNYVYDYKNKILEVKGDLNNIELCFTDLPPAVVSAGGKKSRRRKSKRSKRSRRPKRSRR